MIDEKLEMKKVEEVKVAESRPFKFAYIDPASSAHTYFFYEKPDVADKDGRIEAYTADGKKVKVQLQPENIVPLK